jgi:capsular polysaccharide biosynthesis protein
MQEKWDDLDRLILNSFEECQLSSNYNEKLMRKFQKTKRNSIDIAAMSLIVAGFVMMIVISTNLQYKIIKTQYRLKTEIMVVQYKYNENIDILKHLIGAEYNAKKK